MPRAAPARVIRAPGFGCCPRCGGAEPGSLGTASWVASPWSRWQPVVLTNWQSRILSGPEKQGKGRSLYLGSSQGILGIHYQKRTLQPLTWIWLYSARANQLICLAEKQTVIQSLLETSLILHKGLSMCSEPHNLEYQGNKGWRMFRADRNVVILAGIMYA